MLEGAADDVKITRFFLQQIDPLDVGWVANAGEFFKPGIRLLTRIIEYGCAKVVGRKRKLVR